MAASSKLYSFPVTKKATLLGQVGVEGIVTGNQKFRNRQLRYYICQVVLVKS